MNTYAISGMTCGGCRAKVERSLKALAPEATVTLDPPRATLSNSVSLASVNEVLRSIGNYAASEIKPAPLLAKAPGALNAWLATYYPLLLIMSLSALASFAGQSWMMSFMAGFFLVFGAFKLLDVPAFARSY
ncbi:MAG: heavy-metal-associated domain-containing protein, partial [Rhizobiaceae bacterium]